MAMSLKAARVNAGMTQLEAAKSLGISVYTLSNYERGISFPDVINIKKIEKLYNTSYEELIFIPPKLQLNCKKNKAAKKWG